MIAIDHNTRVIFVPQADLTPLGGASYELDVNDFRLWLKDLEDDSDGIQLPDTHRHNTTVQLGSMTLARVVEIINGYTVEFEDGIYSVSLVGGNNNILDVMVLNGVSLRSANSAGMIVVSGGDGGTGECPTVQEIRAEMDANSNKLTLIPGMNQNVSDIETAVNALDVPTAVEIRQEMDANSADLNTIQAAIAAIPPAPSVTAIRQEIDTNSAKLSDIHSDIAAIPPAPSAVAIRQEIDTNSSRFTALDSAVAAKPSASQVRTEMDANSTRLALLPGMNTSITNLGSEISGIPDAVHDETVEPGLTFRALLRLLAATIFGAGEVPTQADGSFAFRDYLGSKERLTGTITDKVRAFTKRDAS